MPGCLGGHSVPDVPHVQHFSSPPAVDFNLLTVYCFLSEQDAGLDALSSIISRQKQMGQEIGNELDEQNGKNVFETDELCH